MTHVTPTSLLATLVGPAPGLDCGIYTAQNAPPKVGVGKGTWSQAFHPSGAEPDWVAPADQPELYAALAWFRSGEGRTASAVVAKRTISADIDAKSMPGASDAERLRQARTLAASLPCPVALVGSGGGFHAHILLPEGERLEVRGAEHVELLGRALRLHLEASAREVLGAPVALDHCHGVERVWRLPLSWNAKAADGARVLTSERGLWRPVTLEYPTSADALTRLPAAEISFLAHFLATAEAEGDGGSKSQQASVATLAPNEGRSPASEEPSVATPQSDHRFEVGMLPERLRARWPLREGDQSANDFAVAGALAEQGWSPSTATRAVRMRRAALQDPSDLAKGAREEYVARTVRAAYMKHAPRRAAALLTPYTPMPMMVLPGPVRAFVEQGAKARCCAPEAIALPLLTALGAAIGTSRWIQIKPGWLEPALLWTAVVLGSGKVKSPAQELALRPVFRRQSRALEMHARERATWEREMKEHKVAMKAWERAAAKGSEDEPPAAPERPTAKRMLVSDTTLEGLIPILGENARGVLLVRDELAGWFSSFDAYRNGKGGDLQQWLSAHRAGPLLVDRKIGRQTLYVPRGFVAVTGGIQPRTLRRALTREFFDSGMAARLLLVMPDAPRKQWSEAEVPLSTLHDVEHVFDRLFRIPVIDSEDEGDRGDRLSLHPDAKALWIDYYNEIGREQDALGAEDDLGAALAKLEGGAARIALILALAKYGCSDAEIVPTVIEPECMHAGITLARWFAAETARVYARCEMESGSGARSAVVAWLRDANGTASARDLQRGPRAFRQDLLRAQEALDDLVTSGLAWKSRRSPSAGGHTELVYELRVTVRGTSHEAATSNEAQTLARREPGCDDA